ncbi:polyprenyl synthetase family protein [Bacillus massilinigeriensis]|uniref:polyprenyl synthetase family protein n=1 Tax=Bacillus mediterraneensis TaxID=1805474 RepID=UPI000A9C76BC|nr:farnesyl diphosphate synthase [Bacillus mediterraneensis]
MDSKRCDQFINEYKQLVEQYISEQVKKIAAPAILKESMQYSLEAGGKRIRPLLLFATLDAFGKSPAIGLETAGAIEMVHTYSLIHDDLPSMDNDALRRGKPTNHIIFGDATAILAGDALLTYSFRLITDIPEDVASAEIKLSLIAGLSNAAGAEGMVGGQTADMQGEGKSLSLEELKYIHLNKTGRLLEYSVLAGAAIAQADSETKRQLSTFAQHLGLAFQIRDDILDLEGTEEQIGKPVGSDKNNKKSTYPSLLTMEGAKKALEEQIGKAKAALGSTNLQTELLSEITELIGNRKS